MNHILETQKPVKEGFLAILPRMVPSKAIFLLGVDGKDLGPVDLYSKYSRPLDPPDLIESASRMHFAGKPLEKVYRFFVRSSSLKSFPTSGLQQKAVELSCIR